MADDRQAEDELVRRARNGDVGAYGELYERHSGRVYAVCLRVVGDAARAEDVAQEAFVRAWQKLGSFRGDSSFSTWLHRLAVNVALSELRSRGRWQERSLDEELAAPVTAPRRRSPVAAVDLERAISDLPPKARAIFVLYDIEGYRHQEIAALTGVAEGTSKAHLHRARRLLREALQA